MFSNSGRNPCQFLLFCFPLHWQLLQYDLSSTEVHIKKTKIPCWSKIKHFVKNVALWKLRPWKHKTLFLLSCSLIITSVSPQKPSAYFSWKLWAHFWLYSLNCSPMQKTALIFLFAKQRFGAIVYPQNRHNIGSSRQ